MFTFNKLKPRPAHFNTLWSKPKEKKTEVIHTLQCLSYLGTSPPQAHTSHPSFSLNSVALLTGKFQWKHGEKTRITVHQHFPLSSWVISPKPVILNSIMPQFCKNKISWVHTATILAKSSPSGLHLRAGWVPITCEHLRLLSLPLAVRKWM